MQSIILYLIFEFFKGSFIYDIRKNQVFLALNLPEQLIIIE